MENKKSDFQEDSIITLTNNEGYDINFHIIAGINYKNDYYVILEPLSEYSDLDENELIIFKVKDSKIESHSFELVTDKNIIADIFKEYEKIIHLENN